jgi:hypothetical protein
MIWLRAIARLFAGNPVIGGMLGLILLQAIGFGVQSWKLSHRTKQLETMTSLRLAERENHRLTKGSFRVAMAQAELNQAAAIAARETQWKEMSDAKEQAIQLELGRALNDADAYINRLRDAATARTRVASGAGRNQTTPLAGPAAEPARSSGMSELDSNDVRICTVNTVEYRQIKALYEELKVKSEAPATP